MNITLGRPPSHHSPSPVIHHPHRTITFRPTAAIAPDLGCADLFPTRPPPRGCVLADDHTTGRRISANAILDDETDHLKKTTISPPLVFAARFIDPPLTVSVQSGFGNVAQIHRHAL